MNRWASRIGAICYMVWGVLHVWAGGVMLAGDARAQLDAISTAPLPAVDVPPPLAPLIHAGLSFHAYNLVWFGALAFVVAAWLNWRNSVAGYWVNLVVVGADDLGLVWFLILPGHLTFAEAGLGPVLFVFAAVFTTIGVLGRKRRAASPR